jgi:FkbM family methyltransferase
LTLDPWAGLPPPLTGTVTHADHGEDVILRVMFDVMGMPKPSYLDVGAFDPWHINNTALLYASGARGINIEPNPKLIGAFNKHRPEDLNLCCAVGTQRMASRTLHLGDNPGLSSFNRELSGVDYVGEIEVPVWTIPDILIGHRDGFWPDLLTIDIEGEDVSVLSHCLPANGDRPSVVVVESLRLTDDYSGEWLKLMPQRNYSLYFRTRSNMIWVTPETATQLTD